jgi:hypothetical protein
VPQDVSKTFSKVKAVKFTTSKSPLLGESDPLKKMELLQNDDMLVHFLLLYLNTSVWVLERKGLI